MVLDEVDDTLTVSWNCRDGDAVAPGDVIGTISGSARSILVAERIVLNFMQRMSGIATATRAMADAAAPARVLETRKTAPGLRIFDKWAVRLGGAENHRMGLYDMMLIKDNHIAAAGGIRNALDRAEAYMSESGVNVAIEIETRTLDEVREVANIGKDYPHLRRVMLDNMVRIGSDGAVDVSMLEDAMAIISALDGIETEASGNVTLKTAAAIANTGVTFVSVGGLTHSVQALDISLNM